MQTAAVFEQLITIFLQMDCIVNSAAFNHKLLADLFHLIAVSLHS